MNRMNRWNQSQIIIVSLILAIFLSACHPVGQSSSTNNQGNISEEQVRMIQHLNEIAESAYHDLQIGDIEAMHQKVAQITLLSMKMSYENVVTIEGMQVVSQTISETMNALRAVTPDQQQIATHMAKMRLVLDALKKSEQPMWLDFHQPMVRSLRQIVDAAVMSSSEDASTSLIAWNNQIQIIRPSVVVSRDATDAATLDSMTTFLKSRIEARDWQAIIQANAEITQRVDEIFHLTKDQDEETAAPVVPINQPNDPLIWSLILGLLIVMTLSYVAWRKYEVERGIVRVKKENDFKQVE
jgi:sporulation protein YpjB